MKFAFHLTCFAAVCALSLAFVSPVRAQDTRTVGAGETYDFSAAGASDQTVRYYTVDGGTINMGGGTGPYTGTLDVINGGTFNRNGGWVTFGEFADTTATVTVNGGTFNSNNYGDYVVISNYGPTVMYVGGDASTNGNNADASVKGGKMDLNNSLNRHNNVGSLMMSNLAGKGTLYVYGSTDPTAANYTEIDLHAGLTMANGSSGQNWVYQYGGVVNVNTGNLNNAGVQMNNCGGNDYQIYGGKLNINGNKGMVISKGLYKIAGGESTMYKLDGNANGSLVWTYLFDGSLTLGAGGINNVYERFYFGGGTLSASADYTIANTVKIALQSDTATTGTTGTINTNGHTITLAGTINGAGNLTKQGVGTLAITSADNTASTVVVQNGTIEIAQGASATYGNLFFDEATATPANSSVNVKGSLSFSTVNAADQDTRYITVDGGTANMTGWSGAYGGTLDVINGGTFNRVSGWTSFGEFTGSKAVVTVNGGTLASNSFSDFIVLSNLGESVMYLGGDVTTNGDNNAASVKGGKIDFNNSADRHGNVGTFTFANMPGGKGTLYVYGSTDPTAPNYTEIDLAGGMTMSADNGHENVGNFVYQYGGVVSINTSSLGNSGLVMNVGCGNDYHLYGGQLNINGDKGAVIIRGQLRIAGGEAAMYKLDGTATGGDVWAYLFGGSLTLGAGGINNAYDRFYFGGGTLSASADYTIANTVRIALQSDTATTGTTGTINTNGHTITLEGIIAGQGSLVKDGAGTLLVKSENSYTGTTTVKAGTLELAPNGSIASATTVDGGILKMNGGAIKSSVTALNGIVYVEPEEGNLIGSLLIEAGANLTFDLPDVADADELLEVSAVNGSTGALTIEDGAQMTLLLDSKESAGTYKLYSADSQTGAFDEILLKIGAAEAFNIANLGLVYGRGDAFYFNAGQISSAVPEPSTWALLTLGLVSMGWFCRRKRQAKD